MSSALFLSAHLLAYLSRSKASLFCVCARCGDDVGDRTGPNQCRQKQCAGDLAAMLT